jgi:hypothetical protein
LGQRWYRTGSGKAMSPNVPKANIFLTLTLQILSFSQPLVQVLGRTNHDDDKEKDVFVLTGNSLQKWLLIEDEEPDKMFYACDICALAKNAFANTVWVSGKLY